MSIERALRICSIGSARTVAVQMRTRCLAARGHRVAILSPDAVAVPGIEVLAPSAGHRNVMRRVLSYLQMIVLLWRWRADVVVVHFGAQPFAWLLPLIWFKPFAVSVMGGDILFHQTSHFSPRRRRATLSLLEISDRVISMSDYLIAPYPKLHSRSLITPWGIDFEQFAATTDTAVSQRRELRAALGIAARTPVVLSPRRLVPVCNVASIVEAMALVREGVEDAVLVLLDDAPNASYRQRVADCIERLGGAVEVRWLTRADYTSMPDMYAIADVTVSVAQSDGVSLAVLESMAAGVPVVLGRLPNYAGVFDDGLHCRTVDPDDPRAIAAGIIEVLTDTSLRAVLIREAQSKARRDGNLEREAARVETMLQDMVRERHRPQRIVRRIAHALNLALLVFESHTRR